MLQGNVESEKTATKVETILKWAQDAGKDTGKLSRESLRKGRISTVDFLVLDNIDQQLAVLIIQTIFTLR